MTGLGVVLVPSEEIADNKHLPNTCVKKAN